MGHPAPFPRRNGSWHRGGSGARRVDRQRLFSSPSISNPFFLRFQNREDQPNDKTEGEEEAVSIDAEAAQSEKNGGHNR